MTIARPMIETARLRLRPVLQADVVLLPGRDCEEPTNFYALAITR